MTDHAAAVEAVHAWNCACAIVEGGDKYCHELRATLLRAYEAVVVKLNQKYDAMVEADFNTLDHVIGERDREIATLRAQHAALVETLNDIMAWGVEFDDERLDYISVQVPRASIADAKKLLATLGGAKGA